MKTKLPKQELRERLLADQLKRLMAAAHKQSDYDVDSELALENYASADLLEKLGYGGKDGSGDAPPAWGSAVRYLRVQNKVFRESIRDLLAIANPKTDSEASCYNYAESLLEEAGNDE